MRIIMRSRFSFSYTSSPSDSGSGACRFGHAPVKVLRKVAVLAGPSDAVASHMMRTMCVQQGVHHVQQRQIDAIDAIDAIATGVVCLEVRTWMSQRKTTLPTRLEMSTSSRVAPFGISDRPSSLAL